MDRCAVLQLQVDRLTCSNTSTRWHSQAPDEPTRAPFATQSATHFDLADEPSYEVVDIQFDDRAVCVHGLSPRFTSANRLRSARRAVQGWASNATQAVLDRVTTVPQSRSRRIFCVSPRAGAIIASGADRPGLRPLDFRYRSPVRHQEHRQVAGHHRQDTAQRLHHGNPALGRSVLPRMSQKLLRMIKE